MRRPPSEKLEIIRLVEQSRQPARRTLEQLGIPRRFLITPSVPDSHRVGWGVISGSDALTGA